MEREKRKKRGGGGEKKKKAACMWNTNVEPSPWSFEWLKVPLYFQKHYYHTGEKYVKLN